MARLIEYNVEGVEASSGGTGVKAPLGLRIGKIMLCEHREKKADGTPANDIRVGISVGDEYDWLFTYIGLGPESDWKLAEFIRALGLKDKGKVDPAKQVGKLIRVKVNPGEYQGQYSPEAGRLMPPQDGDTFGDSASELSASSNGASGGGTDEPEAAVAADDGGFEAWREGTERDGETVASYDDWTDDDLEAEVNDRGLTIPGGRGAKKVKLITALRADDSAATEAGDGDAEPAATAATTDGDDYDEWDLEQLKGEWEERQLGDLPVVRGSNAEGRLMAKIIEALREDDSTNPFEG